jgi:type IV secretory pathway VirB6-like protein
MHRFFKKNLLVLKQYLSCFLFVVFFTFGITQNVFAIKDIATEQEYKPKTGNNKVVTFNTNMPNLDIWPYFGVGDIDLFNGDMTIEATNPFCIAYAIAFLLAMNLGNAAVKAVAVGSLIIAVTVIYGIAYQKLKDLEICGADWLVWGSSSYGSEVDLSNIKKYYPNFGSYKGSWRWIAEKCVKNTGACRVWCSEQHDETCKIYNGEDSNDCLKGDRPCYLFIDWLSKGGTPRTTLDMRDKLFREYYYGGEEIRGVSCLDPRAEAVEYDVNDKDNVYDFVSSGNNNWDNGDGKKNRFAEGIDGNSYPRQLYYFKGTETPNYACDRFLLGLPDQYKNLDINDNSHPYTCCMNESKSKVCVRDNLNTIGAGYDGTGTSTSVKFCDINDVLCTLNGIILQVQKTSGDKYCVNTWSLCPFNFNLQKGSEKILNFEIVKNGNDYEDECVEKEKDSTKETVFPCKGRPKNFYQLDRHCVYIAPAPSMPDEAQSYSPYFDKSCINLVGSSHNSYGYKAYKGYMKATSMYSSTFSAPLVECFTETIKNLLNNKAGHTRCNDENEIPSDEESCVSGTFFIKGENFDETKTFESATSRLMKLIRALVLDAMAIMLMLYGLQILTNMGKFEMKELYIMMIKLVVVAGFTYDIFWSKQLFQLVFTFTDWVNSMVIRTSINTDIDGENNLIRDDGCYFGNMTDMIGKMDEWKLSKMPNNNYGLYPLDRKYVMFFDTLDCKISKWLGMSMLGSTGKIINMIAITFIWPFNIGLFMLVGSLIFMFMVINFAVQAVYMFVGCMLALGGLMFVSPLLIPCILFKKTKSYFDNWIKQIISFALQPVVLFVFISMSIVIMDQYMLGEAIYVGTGRDKQLICGYACFETKPTSYNPNTGYLEARRLLLDHTEETSTLSEDFIKKQTACLAHEGINTEWVELKSNSFLCFMDSIQKSTGPLAPLQALGIFLSSLKDIGNSPLAMIFRCVLLILILNASLKQMKNVAKAIFGGTQFGTSLKSDPFHLAMRAFQAAEMTKRIGSQAAKGVVNKANEAREKRKAGVDARPDDYDDKSEPEKNTPPDDDKQKPEDANKPEAEDQNPKKEGEGDEPSPETPEEPTPEEDV